MHPQITIIGCLKENFFFLSLAGTHLEFAVQVHEYYAEIKQCICYGPCGVGCHKSVDVNRRADF